MSLISQDFLTSQELAAIKEVTVRTVQSWVKHGIAPPFVVVEGRRWFRKNEALAFEAPRRGRKHKAATA